MSTEILHTFPVKRNWPRAALSLWRLMMNKEDTKQPFIYFDSTCGPQTERNFARYLASAEGRQRLDEMMDLKSVLSDTARLGALPKNTLGGAYLDFITTEGLSAKGLADIEISSNISMLRLEPMRRQFLATGFQLHDVFHVILGYGRDFVGEACNLAFTAEQQKLNPIRLLSLSMGLKEKFVYPSLPIFDCLKEAEEISQNCKWMFDKDWNALMAVDLDDARQQLDIKMPELYLEHQETFSRVDAERREKIAEAFAPTLSH